MARKTSKTSSKSRQDKKGRGRLIAMRLASWAILAACIIAVTMGTRWAFTTFFYLKNPHFTLREIRINTEKGPIEPETIRALIDYREDQVNLLTIDIAAVRAAIMQHPMVEQVEVRQLLPDTLYVRVFGRAPVARLLTPQGRLMDREGLVLPPVVKTQSGNLPIITGIPGIGNYQIGDTIEHPLMLTALRFLTARDTLTNGHWLDVRMIQLGTHYDELRVYLRRNDRCLIREDALLLLPSDDVEHAVQRALTTIEERARTNQPTSQLDAISRKVIVLP